MEKEQREGHPGRRESMSRGTQRRTRPDGGSLDVRDGREVLSCLSTLSDGCGVAPSSVGLRRLLRLRLCLGREPCGSITSVHHRADIQRSGT